MWNGHALCVLHHRLFDRGVFTVDEGRRVMTVTRVCGDEVRAIRWDLDGTWSPHAKASLLRTKQAHPGPQAGPSRRPTRRWPSVVPTRKYLC